MFRFKFVAEYMKGVNMSDNLNDRLGTSEVIWNLEDLYTGITDPAIDQEISRSEAEAGDINAGYAGRLDSLDEIELNTLVSRLEALAAAMGRLGTFACLNFSARTKDSEAGAFMQKIREANSRIGKETVFFELEWASLAKEKADPLLAASTLSHFSHYLETLRLFAPHLLSQIEESLLLEMAPVGRGSWNVLFDKIMGHLKFGEHERSEEEVLTDLYNKDREVRKQAAAELTEGLNSQLHILTHIFNTLLAEKMISDRLRKHDSWLGSMNLNNELPDSTVDVLINTVTSRYDIPTRYYHIKRTILDLPELTDYDRYAPLPNLPGDEIPWQKCKEMVIKAFDDFSPEMGNIAAKFFDRRWIHAPVIDGKRGGAFAHPCVPDVHPYIMVNYTGNLRDVSTVAHELGHGIHQYLAADCGYFNSSTPLVLAETASVFGELLVFNFQLDCLSDEKERRAFTCQKLESIFATVFRQVAMNRFEDLTHNARRDSGELSSDEISEYWLNTQRAMFGDSVNLTEDYSIWWSYIPHFLSTPGYVYSYAFGELLVLALYSLYQKERESFVPKYMQLLRSGGSKSPAELLRPFGVNPDDPQFWNQGLEIISRMLDTVE